MQYMWILFNFVLNSYYIFSFYTVCFNVQRSTEVFTLGLRTLVMTFQASLSMESLSLSGGSAQDRLRPRDANNRCWKNTNMNINYETLSFWPVCRLQMCVCHLGKSSFITVFDHANKVCRSRCDKFCPECPHDRVQQESTMGK